MEKYNLKNDTMKESTLQSIFTYPIYPGISKKYSDKAFINIDNGAQGGTHWTCFFFKKKMTNVIILIVSGQLQIKFYLTTFSKFKILS